MRTDVCNYRTVKKPSTHLGRISGNSFARKLILIFLPTFLIPFFILGVVFYQVNLRNSRGKITDAIQLTGRQIAGQIDNRFAQLDRVSDTIEYYMYGLPNNSSSVGTDTSVLDAYSALRTNATSLKATFAFSHVCFFLQNDKLYHRERLMFYSLDQLNQFGISPDAIGDDDASCWLYRPNQNYPFMLDMTYDSYSEILRVRAQRNSFSGSFNYVFFISLDTEEINALLSDAYEAGGGISGCLLTEDCTVVATSDASVFVPGAALADETLTEAIGQGKTSAESANGTCYVQTLSNGWHYLTCVEPRYILANSSAYIYVLTIVLLILLPLISLLIVYLTKNMTQRITLLSETVRDVNFDQNQFHAGTVDYVKEVPEAGFDEIDRLADTYNKMVGIVYDNINHITELAAREQTLKYRLLQSLINPHFLYNILDSVATCNRIGKPELANKMIMDLTRFYRMTLRKSNELITIRDELEIASLYMELESLCRGGNFTWEIRKEEEIENFMICKFTLQPFIENSIRHGMQGLNQHLHILIDIRYADENIIILIRDNGHGIPEEKLQELQRSLASGEVDTDRHFGICNVNARISSELFGHGFIEIDSEYEKGTTIKIEFQQILPN